MLSAGQTVAGEVDSLRALLTRHVSRHKLPSLSIPAGVSQVDTAGGERLTLAALDGRLAVYSCRGAAQITRTDQYAGNGIVHTIDAVI